MKRLLLSAIAAALLLAPTFHPAAAQTIDASTFSCRDLVQSAQSSDKTTVYGVTAILYWMEGYEATSDQGTVVDFDNVSKEFAATTDYCAKNPAVGVMSAADKFMGENAEDATPKAIDLALLTCQAVTTSKAGDEEGLGQILMWLAGYHASIAKTTVMDLDKFKSDAGKIGTYCAEHPEMGLVTASEKYMAGDGADGASSGE